MEKALEILRTKDLERRINLLAGHDECDPGLWKLLELESQPELDFNLLLSAYTGPLEELKYLIKDFAADLAESYHPLSKLVSDYLGLSINANYYRCFTSGLTLPTFEIATLMTLGYNDHQIVRLTARTSKIISPFVEPERCLAVINHIRWPSLMSQMDWAGEYSVKGGEHKTGDVERELMEDAAKFKPVETVVREYDMGLIGDASDIFDF